MLSIMILLLSVHTAAPAPGPVVSPPAGAEGRAVAPPAVALAASGTSAPLAAVPGASAPTAPSVPEITTVLAVADGPLGPSVELAELTHQLRAACRDRATGVQDAQEVRRRFLGATADVSLAALERAYVGAQAAFQADELDSASRTLRAILQDLEALPDSREGYALRLRTLLRLALTERTAKRTAAMGDAVGRLLALEPRFTVDAQQYSPSFRREFEELRRRAAQRPVHALAIASSGSPLVAYVDGKEVGRTPARILLPAGRYRVTGGDGVRPPPVVVEVGSADREVTLDAALAEAVRLDAGPGLAASGEGRGALLVRAGAALGADRVVAVSISGGTEGVLLAGAVHDVGRGVVVREGRVRVAGEPSPALGSLAVFLLTGQPAPGVEPVAPVALAVAETPASLLRRPVALEAAEPRRPAPARWLRPAAYAGGAAALGLAVLATTQALSARASYRQAEAMVRSDGTFVAGADRASYDQALGAASSAQRAAWVGAAGAAVFAVAAGVLGYLSIDSGGAPAAPLATPAVRF